MEQHMVARRLDSSGRPWPRHCPYDGLEPERAGLLKREAPLGHLEPPSSDDAPAARQVAQRRATDEPLDEALASCAALAQRLAALQALADPATQRQLMLQLPAALQAASAALSRLETAGDPELRADRGADALTGLADRSQLLAGAARQAAQYPDAPLMVLAIAVDHLRHVNDT